MPAFNEGRHICRNLEETVAALRALGKSWEIVVVDDGSTDETWEEAQRAARRFPEIKVVGSSGNRGKGWAVRRGFSRCRGELVFFLDSDLDIHPRQFRSLLDILENDRVDIVIGAKRHPASTVNYPPARRAISAGYFFLVKLLFGLPLRDTQTGIKLFRRRALESVLPRVMVKKYAFDLELLVAAHVCGFAIAEAPVVVDLKGKFGRVGAHAIWTMLIDTLAVFYRLRILGYYGRTLFVPASYPPVSVVVAYRRRNPYLEECLRHLEKLNYPDFEVILLPDERESFPGPWRVIPTGPVSPPRKRDLGWKSARGEIVAFIDDDAFPDEEWLRNAVRRFAEPGVAAVGGPGTTPENDSRNRKAGGRVLASLLVGGVHAFRVIPRIPRDVDDYPTFNLLVKKTVLEEIGGFDCPWWPGEDTVLCLKIRESGGRIVYDPDVEVRHHRRPLFRPHWRQFASYGLHRGYFVRKFPATSRRLNYFLPSIWLLFLAGGWLPALIVPWWKFVWAVPAALYLGAAFLSAARYLFDPPTAAMVLAGIVTTHAVYGWAFLRGLLASRMPEEEG